MEVALEEPELRKKILALEAKYKDTPKARNAVRCHPRGPVLLTNAHVKRFPTSERLASQGGRASIIGGRSILTLKIHDDSLS